MTRVWLRQTAAVIGLEWKKSFLSRRGWWVYLLALAPVGLSLLHTTVAGRITWRHHTLAQDTEMFAGLYQIYFLRLGIFFGCLGIFSNLFRGEMLEKTLHYYFLTPVRRELLVLGKFLAGLAAAVVIFEASTVASFLIWGQHQGAVFHDFVWHGAGAAQLGWYAAVTGLACVGYGAVFLLAVLLIRNPMIPAAAVFVWENLNPFLPPLLKKVSVIFYLKSLSPVAVPVPPRLAIWVVSADPTPVWLAVPGLLAVSLALLTYAAVSARRAQISYGE